MLLTYLERLKQISTSETGISVKLLGFPSYVFAQSIYEITKRPVSTN